ncbi:MAG: PEP-CTERM sorting domain-containing protein [Candidatus Omnitrophota bacterium]
MTPEPVSALLFLIGGAAMAGAGLKRKTLKTGCNI